MDGIVIVAIVFGAIVAVILGPIWIKERTKQSAHQLISQAIEKGQNLDPALMEKLTEAVQRQPNQARRTLGSGVVLIALAIAFAASSLFSDGWDPSGMAGSGMMVPAIILGALGAAFVLLAVIDYASKKKTGV